MAKRLEILIRTLAKIPLFSGLSAAQIQSVVGACRATRYPAGQVVAAGGAEEAFHILLSGNLGVVSGEGLLVATLEPVTTVGELGIATRQRHRARVEALEDCNVLVLERAALERLLAADLAMQARLLRNTVDILAEKIVQDNVRMREYLSEKVEREQRLKGYRRRADLTLNLAVAELGLGRDEVEARLDDLEMASRDLRVVVVDDEADVRRLLCEVLADYDTVEARDGEEALDEIGDEPPDLVVTDIRMPGMDGYALLGRLRERCPRTKVLGISGYATDADARGYRFDGFMEKPMNLKDFRHLVDSAMGLGR